MTRVGFQAMQLRWLLLGVLVAALLATACDDEEDGNGTAVADGTETPTATETATTTPDGTATGTPQQGSDQPGSGQQAQRYGQALQLALQDELGSTDVQELISEWNIDVTPDGDGWRANGRKYYIGNGRAGEPDLPDAVRGLSRRRPGRRDRSAAGR